MVWSTPRGSQLLPILKTPPSHMINGAINLQPPKGPTDTSHRLLRQGALGRGASTVDHIENRRFFPFGVARDATATATERLPIATPACFNSVSDFFYEVVCMYNVVL